MFIFNCWCPLELDMWLLNAVKLLDAEWSGLLWAFLKLNQQTTGSTVSVKCNWFFISIIFLILQIQLKFRRLYFSATYTIISCQFCLLTASYLLKQQFNYKQGPSDPCSESYMIGIAPNWQTVLKLEYFSCNAPRSKWWLEINPYILCFLARFHWYMYFVCSAANTEKSTHFCHVLHNLIPMVLWFFLFLVEI